MTVYTYTASDVEIRLNGCAVINE